MRTLLFVLMFALTSSLYAQTMQSPSPKLIEMVLTVPTDCLILDANGLSVNYEGNLLAVCSLEKTGTEWSVKVAGYCPNGHRVVCRCGGCAISSCGYCCSCCTDDYKKPS